MNRLEKALGKLLGENEIALGSEGDEAIAAKIEELAGKLAEMRQKLADAEAAIAALTEEKAAAETKAEALELSAEKEKKQSLITNALADGRITNAQAEALGRLDSVALGEFLAATKGRCVPGKGPAPKEEEKELALSDVEKDMARRMGISETEMLKTKKANCN